jgi:hypothetical protein
MIMKTYSSTEFRQIFQSKFNLKDWYDLLINYFSVKQLRKDPESISEADANEQGFFLGSFETTDSYNVGLFYFKIQQGSVAHKRVGLRNLIRTYINPNYGDFDAALAVFASDDEWRLSFISDIKGEATAPKRYSFVFGDKNALYRTAVDRFLLLQNTGISYATIKDAFSVEKLSDEFFKEYKEQYEKFCNYLNDNSEMRESFSAFNDGTGKAVRDYVKKLMGRLVFLYFIQKKGWLNGDSNYILNLFNNSTLEIQNDFLDKVLEPMYFGLLNTDVNERLNNAEKHNWDFSLIDGWEKIPYLNGGLFESDKLDDCRSIFPREYFADLFNSFSSYNFTIDENDPNDAEIGVDPEMLGKIFENLLEDNKDKGAFYTPKEIVQYMCKESLIQYLVTHKPELQESIKELVNNNNLTDELQIDGNAVAINELLRNVKICDPAIGSGAFPMGLLNEIFVCRRMLHGVIDKVSEFTDAQIKKEIICNNIYGVDIEKGAVDIARLRFWLAIVVDEIDPMPLPNFDYKIMQGDSLRESYGGVDLSKIAKLSKERQFYELSIFDDALDKSKQSLSSLIKQYYSCSNHAVKENLKNEINSNVIEQFEQDNINLDLSSIDFSCNNQFFLWHTWFQEVFDCGGFDIIIGNPPYIQLQKATGRKSTDKKGKEIDEKLGDLYIDEHFETFEKTGDIYCLFYERGIKLLNEKSVLCFITSNKWMRAGYGEKTRAFLGAHNPIKLLDFAGVKIFVNATVDVNILLVSNEANQGATKTCVIKDSSSLNNLSVLNEQNDYSEHNVYTNSKFCEGNSWAILSPIEMSIKNKIESVGTPLKDWDIQINYGIKTGCNDAFIIGSSVRDQILSNCKDAEERQRTEKLIRPILRGRDIKPYGYKWDNLYLISTFPSMHYDIEMYPSVKKYLLSFAKEVLLDEGYKWVVDNYLEEFCMQKLSQTGTIITINGKNIIFGNTPEKSRKKNLNKWYETQDSISYWENFDKHKIMYPNMTKFSPFYYDEKGFYQNDKSFLITGKHLAFLTAFLNSSLFKFCFLNNFPELLGGTRELRKIFFDKIPVILISDEQDLKFKDIVKDIQSNYSNEKALIIDYLLFDIYNLSDEERKCILAVQ